MKTSLFAVAALPLLLGGCERLRNGASEGGPSGSHAGHPAAGSSAGDEAVAWYTCPMHPAVQQPTPGSCPVCGMSLTPVKKSEVETGAIRVDARRRSQFGIELEPAARRRLSSTERLPAVVAWDSDRLFDVSVRVSGWVKDVAGAPGETVRSGQVLFRIFSPELVSAQDDLLRAAAQVGGGDPSAAARRDAARLRLSRLGPSDAEIDRILAGGTTLEDLPVRAARAGVVLERTVVEGGMASPGQTLYRIGDLSTVWVEGALPEGRFGTVQPGQHVRVGAAGLRASLDGVVSELLPEVDATTRTGRVRVRVANPDAALRPDQWATIELTVDEGEHLTVPESAVMYTGPRRVLFVAGEGDLLVPREVQVGAKAEGYVAILGGLEEGESVVRAGNFLVAADSRLKRGGETGGHLPTGASGAAPAESPGSTPAGIDMGAMGGP